MLEEYPESTDVLNDMVEIMKDKKSNSDSTGHWSLDAFSHHTWRKSQRNQERDFLKFAIPAFHEETAVSLYRKELFKRSEIARYLRTTLRTCFTSFVKPRNQISQGKTVQYTSYDFPDDSVLKDIDPCNARDSLDIDDIIQSNDRVVYITMARKSIQDLKKSVGNHYCAKRIPGAPKLNPDVAIAINNLENVCLLSFALLFFSSDALAGAHQECKCLAENACQWPSSRRNRPKRLYYQE